MTRVVCLLVLLLCGCSDADRPPPAAGNGSGTVIPRDAVANGDQRNVIAVGPCNEGEVRECRFYSEPHGNVQSCFVGEQRCIGESWGDCDDAVVVDPADLDDDDSSDSESSESESSSGY